MTILETLSEEQKNVVFKEGLCVVRAGPGSGKTYAVSARFINKLNSWNKKNQGIAVISFTNVAWKEIEKYVQKNTGKEIISPHYLGTIDSFLNKYIVIPFGHLIMGCTCTPKFVGDRISSWDADPGREWEHYKKDFAAVSYNIDGSFCVIHNNWLEFDKKQLKYQDSKYYQNFQMVKTDGWRRGFITQADANYIAYRIVIDYPEITKTLISRFPEFIVDEAQDTSETQMAILDKLIEVGNLQNLMLVGDPDQSIFEWNEAKPELFFQKYEAWKSNSCVLLDNRRSTSEICKATYALSTLPQIASSIVTPVLSLPDIPAVKIIGHNDEDYTSPIREYRGVCEQLQKVIPEINCSILCRSKRLIHKITTSEGQDRSSDKWGDIKKFWRGIDTKLQDLVYAKYLLEQREINLAYRYALMAYIKGRNHILVCSQSDIDQYFMQNTYSSVLKEVSALLDQLPTTDQSFKNWVTAAKDRIKACNLSVKFDVISKCPGFSDKQISVLFQSQNILKYNDNLEISTIHQAKGKSFDSILLICGKKSSTKNYKTLLEEMPKNDGDISRELDILRNEELRNIYVAITRPKYLLWIAVPLQDVEIWEKHLLGNSSQKQKDLSDFF